MRMPILRKIGTEGVRLPMRSNMSSCKKTTHKSKSLPIPTNRKAETDLSPAVRDLADLLAEIVFHQLNNKNRNPTRAGEAQ
jgi:hypothetical protein